MHSTLKISSNTNISKFDNDTYPVIDIIRNASSCSDALSALQYVFENVQSVLLFVGSSNLQIADRYSCLFSNLSNNLVTDLINFQKTQNCSLELLTQSWDVLEKQNFGILSADSLSIKQRLDYDLELRNVERIQNFTVKHDVQQFHFLVGFEGEENATQLHESTNLLCHNCIAALGTKYPLHSLPKIDNEHLLNLERAPTITGRQKQCLQWVAAGKTSYEISVIIGLSENTINNYINGACIRLNAMSRSHAIVLALQMGLIDWP